MRYLISLLGLAAAFFCSTGSVFAFETLRIGYQKSSVLITVLKTQGTLERDLTALGFDVRWSEFSSGLPLLKALNVGGIDLSADVADTVPVFAQAAGAELTYFAQEAPSPKAQGILVAGHSPVQTLADLKGKRIAVTKGAGVHYLLIASLAKAGLSISDVEMLYLSPPDARAAFERGSVDAWVTWDPFLAAAQKQAGARLIADGEGIAAYQRYYLASSSFAAKRPDVLTLVFKHLREAGLWVKGNPKEAAVLLAPAWGLEPVIIEEANSRRSYDVRAVTPENLAEQQTVADVFASASIIPRKIDTSRAPIWQPSKL